MATKQDVQAKLKSLGVNREATDTDVFNVNKYGASILDNQFGKNGGVPTNPDPMDNKTPNQAGQIASTTTTPTALPTLDQLKQQEQVGIQKEAELSDQGATASKLLGELLKVKQQAAPFDQRIAKVQERIGAKTFKDYMDQGMSFNQAIASMQGDIARANSQVNFYSAKKQEAATSADKLITSFTDEMNRQLQAVGLQVSRIQQQVATAQTAQDNAVSLAFSTPALLSGVMPPGVPENMRASWEAQSNELKRQQALSERPRGSGNAQMSQSEKDKRAFNQDAANVRLQIGANEMDFWTGWDYLRIAYPNVDQNTISETLGGGYDEAKGGFWGRGAETTQTGPF